MSKTEIIALGTGSAFTMKNWQTNFIVRRNGKNLLIDCGSDVRWAMRDQKINFTDIDAVYISHAHADHIGGMEFLGFTRYFTRKYMLDARRRSGDAPPPIALPTLYCARELVRSIWDHSLRGGMEGLEGVDADIDTYFNVRPVEKNGSFNWEGLKFDMVQSLHISAKYCIVDSFGLMFNDTNGKRIYITTDVQFAPETAMKAYYAESDVIFHDCETMYKSGVHAHYDDLRTLAPKIKAKMRLLHYQDNAADPPRPDLFEYWDMIPAENQEEIIARYEVENHNFADWNEKAKKDGFYGFMRPGLVYSSDE
jgi:hypothetical protein